MRLYKHFYLRIFKPILMERKISIVWSRGLKQYTSATVLVWPHVSFLFLMTYRRKVHLIFLLWPISCFGRSQVFLKPSRLSSEFWYLSVWRSPLEWSNLLYFWNRSGSCRSDRIVGYVKSFRKILLFLWCHSFTDNCLVLGSGWQFILSALAGTSVLARVYFWL